MLIDKRAAIVRRGKLDGGVDTRALNRCKRRASQALLLTVLLCSRDDRIFCNVHTRFDVAADKKRRYLERTVDTVIHRDKNAIGCNLSHGVYLEEASRRSRAIVVKIDSVVIEQPIRSLADAVYRRHLQRVR